MGFGQVLNKLLTGKAKNYEYLNNIKIIFYII
jgi:hypothetical protein